MKKKFLPLAGILVGLVFLAYSIYFNIHLGIIMDEKNLGNESVVNTANTWSWVILFTSMITVVACLLSIIFKKNIRLLRILSLLFIIILIIQGIFTQVAIKEVESISAKATSIMEPSVLNKITLSDIKETLETKKKEYFI
ncbi:hypothetical protein [Listeria grayi]|uniref:hypothetical protein n=1 Tax=Listeria grayi TaxID=1641 RepID=UPI00162837B4|nr:hypothetical protein [Listeria grayi]MBC1921993.1 hypothetical protein [Listeria grayi]